MHVKSQSIASTSNTTYWWALKTQKESVIFEPARTHHLALKAENFENQIFTFGCFSLKAVYIFCKLQRLLKVAKFLFMYSFTHTNIVFLFRHLPTETVTFINVCYHMKCFSGDRFSFFFQVFPGLFFHSQLGLCMLLTYCFLKFSLMRATWQDWLELFPWCLTFRESIVSACKRYIDHQYSESVSNKNLALHWG